MDQIFQTLLASSNNDERRRAEASLKKIQKAQPAQFLQYALSIACTPEGSPASFFAASVLCEFVEHHWNASSSLTANDKQTVIQTLLTFFVNTPLAQPLGPQSRKLSIVFAVVVKSEIPVKLVTKGAVPPLLESILQSITEAIRQMTPQTLQCLFVLHLLLKELSAKRVGKLFATVTQSLAPFVEMLLVTPWGDGKAFVVVLKIALRVYGKGTFRAQALQHLVEQSYHYAGLIAKTAATSSLSSSSSDPEARTQVRVLEYSIKILLQSLESFVSRLEELGLPFFVSSEHSLLRFATMVIQACAGPYLKHRADARRHADDDMSGDHSDGSEDVGFTSKLACRAMQIFQYLLTMDESNAFVQSVFQSFSASEMSPQLITILVEQYLQDDVSAVAAAAWNNKPERYVEELDVVQDETEPSCCAEQLFLALTGSATCASLTVPQVWTVIPQLLASGNDSHVCAALHAIGLGYNTLSPEGENASYLSFLTEKLVPLVQQGQCSPFVLRRSVWVIGMWCEHVVQPALRQSLHAVVFQPLLSLEKDPVVLLTALRAVEHFITDTNFTLEEVGGAGSPYVLQILHAVRTVIPQLAEAAMIKEVVGLCLSLLDKKTLQTEANDGSAGESILFVLESTVDRFMQYAKQLEQQQNTENGGDDDDDDEEESGSRELATFGIVLETLAVAVKATTRKPDVIWKLLDVVLVCTQPNTAVVTWTEDHGWDLLREMIYATPTPAPTDPPQVTGKLREALHYCVRHLERDFSALPTVLQCITGLVLALDNGNPAAITTEEIQGLLQRTVVAFQNTDGDVLNAYCSLGMVLLCRFPSLVAGTAYVEGCERAAFERLGRGEMDDVCSDDAAPAMAMLLGLILSRADLRPLRVLTSPAQYAPGAFQQQFSSLMERLSLLLDVIGNPFISQVVVRGMIGLVQDGLVCDPSDVALAQQAHATVTAAAAAAVASPQAQEEVGRSAGKWSPGTDGRRAQQDGNEEDEEDLIGEHRDPREVLLEAFSGGYGVQVSGPHSQRMLQLFESVSSM